MTAIDFSEEALKRLNYFADKECLDITIRQVDLSDNKAMIALDKFDAIIMNHFRPNPELYPELMRHLNKNGILWVNGFREVPLDNLNVTESDILRDDDFALIKAYALENRKLYEIEQRKFVRYIWRKS